MNKQSYFSSLLFKGFLGFLCLGLVWTEIEEIVTDRELALVRRQIPAVMVSNVDVDTARVGTSLFSGDTLITDKNGYAMVLFMDQSVTRVRPESQLIVQGQVNRDRSSNTRIDLNLGEIFMNVNRESQSEVEVGAAGTVASVKGTQFGANSNGYFWVKEGEVEVVLLATGESVTLTSGMYAQASEDGTSLTSGTLSNDELEEHESDYRILDSDLIERSLKLRFRDENGQLREIELDYFEHEN